MKTQALFTLSMAACLATVDSFHLPQGGRNSPSRPSLSLYESSSSSSSDGFGLRKMSKEQLEQRKEDSHEANDNDIASRYMSFASSSPKGVTKSSTWKKEDTEQKQEQVSANTNDICANYDLISTGEYDDYPVPTPNSEEWFTTLAELEDRFEQTRQSLDECTMKQTSGRPTKGIYSFDDSMIDSAGCWQ